MKQQATDPRIALTHLVRGAEPQHLLTGRDVVRGSARRPVVLLALDDGISPSVAIRRARAVAIDLGGDVRVVVALAPRDQHEPTAILSRTLDRVHAVANVLDVELRFGKLCEVASQAATEHCADLVVLSPDAGGTGSVASTIAECTRVPVLVARDPHPDGPIVAATNLIDRRYPVLTASRDLARTLHKRATFFHNAIPIPPGGYFAAIGAGVPMGRPGSDIGMAHQPLARLRALTDGTDANVVVARSPATLDALLAVARERDADIVTVGQRRRSWLARLMGRGFTRELVDRCPRSVLVIPVEDR